MRVPRALLSTAVALAGIVAVACGSPEEQEAATPAPSRPVTAAEQPGLTPRDVQVYLAVKAKALQRMEEELDRLTAGSADLQQAFTGEIKRRLESKL